MKKRFLAILLCLSVLLMACACAAETMEPPAVSETESKASAPQFTLSEVNAESSKTEEPAAPSETAPAESEPEETISMEESDIELEPIQPVDPIQPIEPIKPEEKETTLEFLKDFPVGEDGIIIAMNYHSDATNATLEYPFRYFADEKGNVYYFWQDFFCDLQTGKKLKISSSADYFSSLAASNERIYGITESGKLQTYSMDEGLISSVQIGLPNENLAQQLFVQPDGTVVVRIHDKLFDGNGKEISEFPIKHSKAEGDSKGVLTIYGKSFVCDAFGSLVSGGMNAFTTGDSQYKHFEKACFYNEFLYTQYGANGDLLSKFMVSHFAKGERRDCSIFDSYGKECKYYWSSNVAIGKNVFDGVLSYNFFQSADNTLYLMLLYPDCGKLYRIDPGYSDIGLSNLDEMTLEDLTDPMEVASVGSSLFSANNEARASDPLHVSLARETVERRADYVINTPWVLTDEHQYVRSKHSDHVVFPKFIQEAVEAVNSDDFSITLTGVPYCVGGMNGYETFDASDYQFRSFFDNLVSTATDGHAYTVGNTGDTWLGSDGVGNYELIPRTVGLDCSGFLGSTCGIETKKSPAGLVGYGHELNDMSQLQKHDYMIDGDDHCYFFLEFAPNQDNPSVIEVVVQDCTRTRVTGQKASERRIPLETIQGLDFYNPYYEFVTDATGHAYYCPECDPNADPETLQKTAHTWEYVKDSAGHTQVCSVCNYECTAVSHAYAYTNEESGHVGTCTLCGYVSETLPHVYTYTPAADGHTGTCLCGDSLTAVHAFEYEIMSSGHRQVCNVCGYATETTAHEFEATGVAGAHFFDCSICGFSSGPIPHTFTYAYSNTVHVGTCSECGYRISGTHNVTVSPGDAGGHVYSCVCGYTATQAHTFTYSTYSIIKHRQTCSTCGYSELASHLLSYSHDADGHWQECSLCSFETASLAHNFVDSECTVCGCPQYIIMDIIVIPEEDEPLPVPEDQKATL